MLAVPAGTHPNLNALLEAAPDFGFRPDIKQVSPVDTAFVPAAANVEDTPASPSTMNFVGPAYPSTIRVLSPTGQTLGYALYEVDGKGKVTLHRDTFMTENREEGSGGEARSDESFFTGAVRFLRNFPSSMPFSLEGWFQ